TGNGYYGGVQIDEDNATHYGFTRPDLLTPSDQLRLAKLILRDQGPMAWPVCSERAGLTIADAR
ncbi:MAG TPA: transglycosylase family protein, partial [Mycobacteriales bacterium]|nr:transglycosylase family protein [Mycobacteriales bacterium]